MKTYRCDYCDAAVTDDRLPTGWLVVYEDDFSHPIPSVTLCADCRPPIEYPVMDWDDEGEVVF